MKKTMSIFVVLGGLVALLALFAGGVLSADGQHDEMMVEVSVTNLTRGQILSPVFVARHDAGAEPLYALGQESSDSLAKMAEDADASGLLADWDPETNGNVAEAMVVDLNGGPIKPGETVTMNFDINDGKSMMSFASMLVTTNDAFIGVNALDLSKSRTVNLNAYDSGTEANSEDCAYIPARRAAITPMTRRTLRGSSTSTPGYTAVQAPTWIPRRTIGATPPLASP